VICEFDGYDIDQGLRVRRPTLAVYTVIAYCTAPEDVDTLREVLHVRGFVDGGVKVGPL
jgi:hypothetical protein